MCATRCGVVSLVAAGVLALGACTRDRTPPPPPATSESPVGAPATERVVGPLSPEDARALATMNDRLREYVDVHVKIEGSLPKLPELHSPLQLGPDGKYPVPQPGIKKNREY